ncbi:MAG: preprotein translocase subunit SecE [Acidobacteriaceae bacterium]|nr:preprotein translocase subunit SecE [Acidobacteriaceae bacterium]MBV9497735.1 preprotein translocase subunit SecE [Acidobacteriaceae bacterium]
MEMMTTAVSWPQRTKSYIDEVRGEMRRVSWPSWKQVRATTGVVIAATFLFAAYFAVVDNIVKVIVDKVIHTFTR